MMIDFSVPSSKLQLLCWSDAELSAWDQLAADAEEMSRRVNNPGLSSETTSLAQQVLGAERPERHAAIEDRKICRAIVSLWAGDAKLAARSMRLPVLRKVCEKGRLTRLFTFALANVYFTHFDRLDEWDKGLFTATAEYLRKGIAKQKSTGSLDVIRAVRMHPELSMGEKAPGKLASRILTRDSDVPSMMRGIGLGDYASGRYAEVVRQRVYLDRIDQADPAQSHEWLRDLREPEVANAPASGGRRFGHLVIEAMTAKALDGPSADWQNTILDIAGDPRARGTVGWNKWWSRIPEANLRRVIAWLSGEDIRLFLEAVKQYGERARNYDLQRMFPDRERFLKGLLELNLVRETRLFAGPNARSEIRYIMGDELKTEITELKGGNYRETSVIYMNCGKFHIVEGSHVFKLWVIKGDPPEIMSNWKMRQIESSEFLRALESVGYKNLDYVSLVHNVHMKWIADALMFVAEADEYVPPEAVMSPETYRKVADERVLPARPKNWKPRSRGGE